MRQNIYADICSPSRRRRRSYFLVLQQPRESFSVLAGAGFSTVRRAARVRGNCCHDEGVPRRRRRGDRQRPVLGQPADGVADLERVRPGFGVSGYNQRKLGKPQVLCFGFSLITLFYGFSIAFEGV